MPITLRAETTTGGKTMAVGLASKTAFVVRDNNEQVVMIVWGDDARDAALDWIGRGYRVQRIDPSDVDTDG
ncbi:MAG: hypothetical protein E6G17_11615 [Actinobacteria bacterium]|nr:MAG: hypothetical protein E6G17_11615 [Actinomycetota bacterium]